MSLNLAEEKYIIFKVYTYTLALPIDSVFKVVTCPIQLSQTLRQAKLAQMGQRTVMLVNLHSHLIPNYSHHQQENDSSGRFLIIAQGTAGELYGIQVDAPPNILSIAETSIEKVPHSFHNIGLPTWVSRIAILKHKSEPNTILMLDINQSIPTNNPETMPALHIK
jgi:chemotaxis signal transduction protein